MGERGRIGPNTFLVASTLLCLIGCHENQIQANYPPVKLFPPLVGQGHANGPTTMRTSAVGHDIGKKFPNAIADPRLDGEFPGRTLQGQSFEGMKLGLSSPVVVINYHDIIAHRDKNSVWFDCTTQELEDQLKAMRDSGCHFISVQQLYAYLTREAALPARPVLITFADGYEGVYLRAIPILEKFKVHAIDFIHTGFVGSQIGRPKMTWDQIEELDHDKLLDFGSQTVTHPADLSKLSAPNIINELVTSKVTLESHLKKPELWLAYPNGKFSDECEILARRAGYLMSFSEHTEPANQSKSIMCVNRYVHTKWKLAISQLGKPGKAPPFGRTL